MKRKATKRNPAKTVTLRNFSGKVSKNSDGTVSILGTGRKANPSKRKTRKRVSTALKKYLSNLSPKVRRNVEAGFWNATGFHPLRRSFDYDADRAGDDYGSRSDNKGARAKKAKRRKK